jgi:malonate-semialdehyde dehydrogenase (acetylating)/methylmalonate-semialdehyde dehydrogenase
MTMSRAFDLIEELGLPPGVLSLVNGGKETVDALLDHPQVSAISFVGSSPVAKYIYSRAAANGKRAQCQGGAKNPVVVLPDADMEMATRIIADSSFGCAGQRCLATSVTITVGEAGPAFREQITNVATTRKVGYGRDPQVEMGPVITPESKQRIEALIGKGLNEGAKALVDGRNASIAGYERGNFVRPTVLDNVNPRSELAGIEIFGPVLSLMQAQTIDEAIEYVNAASYGNMACLFTSSGAAARKFRYEAQAGNIGINIGVAAPMAFFPFSGWKESFFGDMHAQGRDAIEFYTQKKVIVERWPREWSRTF